VIQAVATFGLDLLEPADSVLTPLNGFLAGILLGFDPAQAPDVSTSYSVEIDGRRFGFAVTRHGLAGAEDLPAVTVTATAADLITARLGGTGSERKAALRRWQFEGSGAAIEGMRAAFQLSADPGLRLVSRT
jgi:hypothetical protein